MTILSPDMIHQGSSVDLCFLTSFSVFVCTSQEQKIREGLSMMGLKDEVFHISWLIIYSLQVTPFLVTYFIDYTRCNTSFFQLFNTML